MFTLISFIILLLILIFVHELGHFLAAKLLGVKVERFSLGFPPKAISRTIGETEYQLAWLPLGGYVKMLGEDPDSEQAVPPELRARSFSHQPAWAKIVIVLAGPVFNILFAVFLYILVAWLGGEKHLTPVLGPIQPGGPAAEAGLEMDQILLAIDGRPVQYYDDLLAALEAGDGAPLNLTVRGENGERTVRLTPVTRTITTILNDEVTVHELGLSPRVRPVVGRVLDGWPAGEADIRSGDRIVSINGLPARDWQDVLTLIQGLPGERTQEERTVVPPLTMVIERDGQTLTKTLTPRLNPSQDASGRTMYTPLAGLEPQTEYAMESLGFFGGIEAGLKRTGDGLRLMFRSIQKLITREVSAKTLGGPIMIAEVTGEQARAGLLPLLSLAAFISINLGLLNLLPIPVLDGGQLVFFLIEAVRRKPVSLRIREICQWIGMALLGFLMIMVFYNDIARLVTRWQAQTPVEIEAGAGADG